VKELHSKESVEELRNQLFFCATVSKMRSEKKSHMYLNGSE
jgi:hypothetical protein